MIHSQKEQQRYDTTLAHVQSLTTTLENNFISTFHTMTRLSASQNVLKFWKLDHFDPIVTMEAYRMLSKSFDVISRYDTYIGIYNPTIPLVVSNEGTSNLEFLLEQHHFSNFEAILDYAHHTNGTLKDTQRLYISDCGTYFLFLSKNKHIMGQPLFFILFNMDYLLRVFQLDDPSFIFNMVADSSSIKQPTAFTQKSSVLPLVYTAEIPKATYQAPFSLTIRLSLLMLIGVFICFTLWLITKELQRIKHTQDEQRLQREKVLLKEVIYGIKKNNIKEDLCLCGLDFLTSSFYMLFLSPKSKDASSSLSKAALDTHLQQLTPCCAFRSIGLADGDFICFIQGSDRTTLYQDLKQLATSFPSYYLILTEAVTLEKASKKFYDIHQLLKNNTLLNTSPVIKEEKLKVELPTSYQFTEQDKNLLMYYLTNHQEKEFLSLVETILNDNLVERQLTLQYYKQFLTSLCAQLQHFSSDYKDPDMLLESLLGQSDHLKVKATLYDLFGEYYTFLTQEPSKRDMQYRFLEYIHTHYHEDISLADMAETFNLAINYVGVLFKEKTGHNFKDYLNTYRIHMAKAYLEESPYIKIKDLSNQVGFLNINTFIRIFKKYEGVSPGQYQKYLLDRKSD